MTELLEAQIGRLGTFAKQYLQLLTRSNELRRVPQSLRMRAEREMSLGHLSSKTVTPGQLKKLLLSNQVRLFHRLNLVEMNM